MPLIILGLIVILGGCLLIYYQLGPKITLRLKGGRNIFGSGESGVYEAADTENADETAKVENEGAAADAGQDNVKPQKIKDDKVLYIFGNGEREERSFRDDDGRGEDE